MKGEQKPQNNDSKKNVFGHGELHRAVISNDERIVKSLIIDGYDVTEKDPLGFTAVDLANILGKHNLLPFLQGTVTSYESDEDCSSRKLSSSHYHSLRSASLSSISSLRDRVSNILEKSRRRNSMDLHEGQFNDSLSNSECTVDDEETRGGSCWLNIRYSGEDVEKTECSNEKYEETTENLNILQFNKYKNIKYEKPKTSENQQEIKFENTTTDLLKVCVMDENSNYTELSNFELPRECVKSMNCQSNIITEGVSSIVNDSYQYYNGMSEKSKPIEDNKCSFVTGNNFTCIQKDKGENLSIAINNKLITEEDSYKQKESLGQPHKSYVYLNNKRNTCKEEKEIDTTTLSEESLKRFVENNYYVNSVVAENKHCGFAGPLFKRSFSWPLLLGECGHRCKMETWEVWDLDDDETETTNASESSKFSYVNHLDVKENSDSNTTPVKRRGSLSPSPNRRVSVLTSYHGDSTLELHNNFEESLLEEVKTVYTFKNGANKSIENLTQSCDFTSGRTNKKRWSFRESLKERLSLGYKTPRMYSKSKSMESLNKNMDESPKEPKSSALVSRTLSSTRQDLSKIGISDEYDQHLLENDVFHSSSEENIHQSSNEHIEYHQNNLSIPTVNRSQSQNDMEVSIKMDKKTNEDVFLFTDSTVNRAHSSDDLLSSSRKNIKSPVTITQEPSNAPSKNLESPMSKDSQHSPLQLTPTRSRSENQDQNTANPNVQLRNRQPNPDKVGMRSAVDSGYYSPDSMKHFSDTQNISYSITFTPEDHTRGDNNTKLEENPQKTTNKQVESKALQTGLLPLIAIGLGEEQEHDVISSVMTPHSVEEHGEFHLGITHQTGRKFSFTEVDEYVDIDYALDDAGSGKLSNNVQTIQNEKLSERNENGITNSDDDSMVISEDISTNNNNNESVTEENMEKIFQDFQVKNIETNKNCSTPVKDERKLVATPFSPEKHGDSNNKLEINDPQPRHNVTCESVIDKENQEKLGIISGESEEIIQLVEHELFLETPDTRNDSPSNDNDNDNKMRTEENNNNSNGGDDENRDVKNTNENGSIADLKEKNEDTKDKPRIFPGDNENDGNEHENTREQLNGGDEVATEISNIRHFNKASPDNLAVRRKASDQDTPLSPLEDSITSFEAHERELADSSNNNFELSGSEEEFENIYSESDENKKMTTAILSYLPAISEISKEEGECDTLNDDSEEESDDKLKKNETVGDNVRTLSAENLRLHEQESEAEDKKSVKEELLEDFINIKLETDDDKEKIDEGQDGDIIDNKEEGTEKSSQGDGWTKNMSDNVHENSTGEDEETLGTKEDTISHYQFVDPSEQHIDIDEVKGALIISEISEEHATICTRIADDSCDEEDEYCEDMDQSPNRKLSVTETETRPVYSDAPMSDTSDHLSTSYKSADDDNGDITTREESLGLNQEVDFTTKYSIAVPVDDENKVHENITEQWSYKNESHSSCTNDEEKVDKSTANENELEIFDHYIKQDSDNEKIPVDSLQQESPQLDSTENAKLFPPSSPNKVCAASFVTQPSFDDGIDNKNNTVETSNEHVENSGEDTKICAAYTEDSGKKPAAESNDNKIFENEDAITDLEQNKEGESIDKDEGNRIVEPTTNASTNVKDDYESENELSETNKDDSTDVSEQINEDVSNEPTEITVQPKENGNVEPGESRILSEDEDFDITAEHKDTIVLSDDENEQSIIITSDMSQNTPDQDQFPIQDDDNSTNESSSQIPIQYFNIGFTDENGNISQHTKEQAQSIPTTEKEMNKNRDNECEITEVSTTKYQRLLPRQETIENAVRMNEERKRQEKLSRDPSLVWDDFQENCYYTDDLDNNKNNNGKNKVNHTLEENNQKYIDDTNDKLYHLPIKDKTQQSLERRHSNEHLPTISEQDTKYDDSGSEKLTEMYESFDQESLSSDSDVYVQRQITSDVSTISDIENEVPPVSEKKENLLNLEALSQDNPESVIKILKEHQSGTNENNNEWNKEIVQVLKKYVYVPDTYTDVFLILADDTENSDKNIEIASQLYGLIENSELCNFTVVLNNILCHLGVLKSEYPLTKTVRRSKLLSFLITLVGKCTFRSQHLQTFAYFTAKPSLCLGKEKILRVQFLQECFKKEMELIQQELDTDSSLHYITEAFRKLCEYLFHLTTTDQIKSLTVKYIVQKITKENCLQFILNVLMYTGLLKSEKPMHTLDNIKAALVILGYIVEHSKTITNETINILKAFLQQKKRFCLCKKERDILYEQLRSRF